MTIVLLLDKAECGVGRRWFLPFEVLVSGCSERLCHSPHNPGTKPQGTLDPSLPPHIQLLARSHDSRHQVLWPVCLSFPMPCLRPGRHSCPEPLGQRVLPRLSAAALGVPAGQPHLPGASRGFPPLLSHQSCESGNFLGTVTHFCLPHSTLWHSFAYENLSQMTSRCGVKVNWSRANEQPFRTFQQDSDFLAKAQAARQLPK